MMPPDVHADESLRRQEAKQLTVAGLVMLLQRCPQDARVWTEGRDGNGKATVVSDRQDGTVLIQREFYS